MLWAPSLERKEACGSFWARSVWTSGQRGHCSLRRAWPWQVLSLCPHGPRQEEGWLRAEPFSPAGAPLEQRWLCLGGSGESTQWTLHVRVTRAHWSYFVTSREVIKDCHGFITHTDHICAYPQAPPLPRGCVLFWVAGRRGPSLSASSPQEPARLLCFFLCHSPVCQHGQVARARVRRHKGGPH